MAPTVPKEFTVKPQIVFGWDVPSTTYKKFSLESKVSGPPSPHGSATAEIGVKTPVDELIEAVTAGTGAGLTQLITNWQYGN